MKFPNLHIVWTAGKNLALADILSRNTPPELLTRKTTVEIPQNIKFYLAKKNETSPRLECKYAVKTDIDQPQINNLQPFPLYLDCQNNHYEVDLLGTSTFKPIPSHWIKNNTQQKTIKQQPNKKDNFPLIEKENLTDKINLSGPPIKDLKYTKNQVIDLHDPLDTIPLSKLEVEKIFLPPTEKNYTTVITKISKL